MRLAALCILACLLVSGCASAPAVDQPDSTAGFSTVPEALTFMIDCVEQNDMTRLAEACVGEKGTTLAYFNNLVSFHRSNGLKKSYGDKTFPEKGHTFKLGGHGKQFHHLHIDFVKKGEKWHLARIWICR